VEVYSCSAGSESTTPAVIADTSACAGNRFYAKKNMLLAYESENLVQTCRSRIVE